MLLRAQWWCCVRECGDESTWTTRESRRPRGRRGLKRRVKVQRVRRDERGGPRRSLGYDKIRTCYLLPPTFFFSFHFVSFCFARLSTFSFVPLPAIFYLFLFVSLEFILFFIFFCHGTERVPTVARGYVCKSEDGYMRARKVPWKAPRRDNIASR